MDERNPGFKEKENGDMTKSVEGTDLIVLSLDMQTCQVVTSKFRQWKWAIRDKSPFFVWQKQAIFKLEPKGKDRLTLANIFFKKKKWKHPSSIRSVLVGWHIYPCKL